MIIILKAPSAQGFGGKDYYSEIIKISDEKELARIKKDFALKYGVEIDSISVIKREEKQLND